MLKVSVVILTVMLAFSAVYSVLTIVTPAFVVGESYKAVTGKSIDSIQDADYVRVLLGTGRHLGAFALASTLAGVFFLYGAFRHAEAWSWWAVLVVGVISWGWGLVNNFIMGATMNAVMHAAGSLVYLIGLVLPIGSFFGKKT